MAHINSTEVQTAEGVVTVTKTSTHRDYVQASAVQFADGTQSVLSWHLTAEAAAKYARSNEAAKFARYADQKRGTEGATLVLLPVAVQLTGRDAKQAEEAPVEVAAEDAVIVLPAAPQAQTGTTGNTCWCGCGEAIGTRSQYRPGHDARHAGIVARDIAASASTQYMERTTADDDLGSEALVRKAHAMADRLIAKQAKKQAK